MRWAESDTHQFVKLYLGHNCLWNPENDDYKLKYRRQEAHKEIAVQFYAVTNIKLNETEVRQKIKNLRGTYLQEVAKVKQRSTVSSPYKSSLRWFSDYHRCLDGIAKRNVKEEPCYEERMTIEAPEEHKDDISQKVWVSGGSDNGNDNDTNKDTDNDDNKDPFTPTENDFILLLKSEPEESEVKKVKVQNKFKMRKKRFKRHQSSTDRSERSYRSSLDSSADSIVKEDEFDIYGKYIASQLREMGLKKALRVQLQVQSIVSEARLDDS